MKKSSWDVLPLIIASITIPMLSTNKCLLFWFYLCILSDLFVNMTSAAGNSSPFFSFQRSLNCSCMSDSLSNIENKINHRVQDTKEKMKKANQRAETDRLWVRIEALQWALAQILALSG